MSTCTHQSMTNHHAPGVLAEAVELLHTWRERMQQRRELTQWSERDIRDAGMSKGDVLYEASKPFWRA
ncbi:DUF1127 domain-containing protein [Tardiphaga sp.]|uniref:DUF1127 domain-containing protein n=1 Tax=Tardiphaga sp. TaxID=1926292 RepID=UPI002617EFC9|nr:DUF1127 domain-containing protein [Tardiphaga sp.]MDB5620801.1 hypothetical protein [Tardiphaga sp.]